MLDLQSIMMNAQQGMREQSFLGESEDGQVKITMGGNLQATQITFDPELVPAELAAKIAPKIIDALNDANGRAMNGLAGSLLEKVGLGALLGNMPGNPNNK
jgi:DNA-binding protein YbaB